MSANQPHPLKIGLRTTKTALSVSICVLLFRLLDRGSPMLASLSAIFSLRSDHQQTWKFARSRFIGNLFGGIVAISILTTKEYLGLGDWSDVFWAPLAIIILILFCNQFNKTGVINSTATFLVVYFNIEDQSNAIYAVQRVLDTVIGASIAIGINHALPNPHLNTTDK